VSRFVNLELDGAPKDRPPPPGAPVKDEAYYCAAAQAALANGEFEPALRLYGKVLECNPQNPVAWVGQVRMLIELGRFHEAGRWADLALERFPHDPELLAAKGVALGRGGDLPGALAFSDSALEERGDLAYVWLARGDVLLARREARADYCFDKALLLAPRDWQVAWLGARVRCYYRQFALALKLLQQAVEWNATHFLVWLELGRCQEALGLAGPARHSFEQARQLNQNCPAAGLALARVGRMGIGARWRGWWRRWGNG
jgi:tetratricopeptide (TPR) repeat protein